VGIEPAAPPGKISSNPRTHTHTDTQTHRHTDTQTHRHTHTDTDTGKGTEHRKVVVQTETMRLKASIPEFIPSFLHFPTKKSQCLLN